MRVKGTSTTKNRRKKYLKRAKGYYSAGSRCYTVARERYERAMAFAYRDRRQKKRDFRALWNQRISAALSSLDLNYSSFIFGLKQLQVDLDRKVLAEMAILDEDAFLYLAKQAQEKKEQIMQQQQPQSGPQPQSV